MAWGSVRYLSIGILASRAAIRKLCRHMGTRSGIWPAMTAPTRWREFMPALRREVAAPRIEEWVLLCNADSKRTRTDIASFAMRAMDCLSRALPSRDTAPTVLIAVMPNHGMSGPCMGARFSRRQRSCSRGNRKARPPPVEIPARLTGWALAGEHVDDHSLRRQRDFEVV